MPRPTKLTPEITEQICQVLSAGNYIETAAAYVGISRATLYEWLRKGAREGSGRYAGFVSAVERAMAEAEVRSVARIAQAEGTDWRAAAWRLERRAPGRFGRAEVRVIASPSPDTDPGDSSTTAATEPAVATLRTPDDLIGSIETLVAQIESDPDAKPIERGRAISSLLRLAQNVHVTAELKDRIDALESVLIERKRPA
jgi:hypothetical protein